MTATVIDDIRVSVTGGELSEKELKAYADRAKEKFFGKCHFN